MFKINKSPTFIHDVPVNVPVDGGVEEQFLKTRYRVLDLDQLAKFELASGNDKQFAYVDAIVDGFEDLVDQKGDAFTCTGPVRKQLLNTSYIRVALMRAYDEAMLGAKRKN